MFRAGDGLLEVQVPLEQPAPRGHVDVHLIGPRDLSLLTEDLSLTSQLRPPRNQRI